MYIDEWGGGDLENAKGRYEYHMRIEKGERVGEWEGDLNENHLAYCLTRINKSLLIKLSVVLSCFQVNANKRENIET